MAVYRATRKKEKVSENKPKNVVSDESMERLARIMNNSPTLLSLHGTEWAITCLKPGTQWLIAEQACKIVKNEKMSMGDVIREFASNMPAVVNVITLALLNDRDRIFSDYGKSELSAEYRQVYEMLMWGDYKMSDWALLLGEILNLLSMDFFYESINVIETVRQMTLTKKTRKAEQD